VISHPKPRTRRWARRALVASLLVAGVAGTSACTAPSGSAPTDLELDLLLPSFPLSWDTRSTSGFPLSAQMLLIGPLLALQPNGSF
jgi:hypothetical protein